LVFIKLTPGIITLSPKSKILILFNSAIHEKQRYVDEIYVYNVDSEIANCKMKFERLCDLEKKVKVKFRVTFEISLTYTSIW
jgi:hypothetical protein